jgi:putative hydrolase of the HAD superfamily
MAIEWVFLDLGGVLYKLDTIGVLKKFSRRCGRSPAELREELQDHDLFQGYESGAITTDEFYRCVTERLCCELSFSDFVQIWNSLIVKRKPMFKTLRRLRQRVQVLILSNTNEMNARVINEDIGDLTDKIVYSFRVGSLKPDPKIYEEALRVAGSRPGNTLFIDDRKENIEGARVLGMHTHQFRNRRTLIGLLRSYDLYA